MVMHDAQIYGQLVLNNEEMPPEFVAKKVGISPKKYANLLKELEFVGVINRKENGIIYSGRMERDEHERQLNRDRQQRHYDKTHGKDEAEPDDETEKTSRQPNGKPNGASSSSSSFSFSFPFDLKRLIERACEAHPKIDKRLIETAVIETMIRRNGSTKKINSIRYFDEEIKSIEADSKGLSSPTIDIRLKSRRDKLTKIEEEKQK